MAIKIPTETDWTGEGRKPIAGAMERLLKKEANNKPAEQVAQSRMQTVGDYWRIENVNYRNGIYTLDLAKSLLDNGVAKTQDNWAEYSVQAKQKGDFYVGDMPLYHAVFTALFGQKDKQEAEEARAFIQKQMREKYPITLTRIAYQPTGKDKIIHNYELSDKYELKENIFGPDRSILQKDEKALTALLGDGDINRIKSVYNWINGTGVVIWRLNSKPESIDERVARFDAGSDRALLDCSRYPVNSNSALGVRVVREAPQKI